MALRNRVMLPELKQLEEALENSGLNDNHDVEQLAFAIFRDHEDSDDTAIVGDSAGSVLDAGYSGELQEAGYQADADSHE